MHCLTAWGQWAVELLQCTASLPGGSGQRNSCNALPHCLGALGSATSAIHCRTALGAVGSATPAMHCLSALGQWAAELLQRTASLPGSSGQCNSCNALPHCPGGSGQCNSCNGWSECSAGPVGMYYWAHRPGGMGSPTQGVVRASFRVYGGPSSSENRAHRPGGDGESCPGGVRSLLPGRWGAIFFREPGAPAWGERGVQPRGYSEPPASPTRGHLLQRSGRTDLGGTGNPAQGVFGASCQANGGPISSENRAQRPGEDGESSQGGVRSLLPGLRGAIFFREPGAPARGGRGVLPRGFSEPPVRPMGGRNLRRTGRIGPGGTGSPAQGVFGVSCKANRGPSSSENRAHWPGGEGESCPGGVRSLLPGQWGAIFFREPGAQAWGGRGVLPRGCSESPARPVGGHLLQRTGRTGPGGTGSPAQGVFGVSCQANGGPSFSENRAHRPGGDGESCPGGVRILLQGQWGAISFGEPGAPARGGRGVLPRGCSEPPARATGGPSSSENRAHRPGGDGESCPGGVRSLLQGQWGAIFFRELSAPARGGRGVLPRGCSESPVRPIGGHSLQRTGRTGPGGTASPAQGVFGVSCQANGGPSSSANRADPPGADGESCPGGVRSLLPGPRGAILFREPGAPAWGGRGVLPRGCSEPPARPVGGQYLRRTGRTGLGGTGSPAQGVFGASGRTRGYSLLLLNSSRQVSRQYRGS